MSVAETILQQLGGQRFTAMTGSKNYLADGNSLRMTLAKNHSKANRLTITLDEATDTYRMRFYKYIAGLFTEGIKKLLEANEKDKAAQENAFEKWPWLRTAAEK